MQVGRLGHRLDQFETPAVIERWNPASRRRDRAAGTTYPRLGAGRDLLTVVLGAAVWAAIVFYAHVRLFGVNPLA